MKKLINKILIFLNLKKKATRQILEYEKKILETATLKIFKPTTTLITEIAKGGDYKVKILYNTKNGTSEKELPFKMLDSRVLGLPFEIKIEHYLNNSGVLHKESYGLNLCLNIRQGKKQFYTEKNSVTNFSTEFPSQPQYLKGTLKNLKTFQEPPKSSFF